MISDDDNDDNNNNNNNCCYYYFILTKQGVRTRSGYRRQLPDKEETQ
jgi:hypothetical protein